MRGKKTDPSFVSFFIQESIKDGAQTPEDIVLRAKKIITKIDDDIREIELAKKTRSKLLDVISTFEKTNKDHTEEARLLDFFKLSDPKTCKFICDMVKVKPLDKSETNLDPDARFAIKQLLDCKVLARAGERIARGERFDEYMTFVLREGK